MRSVMKTDKESQKWNETIEQNGGGVKSPGSILLVFIDFALVVVGKWGTMPGGYFIGCYRLFLSGGYSTRSSSYWKKDFLDAFSPLYERVCPSVCWSVHLSVRSLFRYACSKTAFLGCSWPRWDPTLNETIDKRVLKVSFAILSFHLSVRPSVSPYTSHI